MTGRLIAVVGPSGVGKDSVMAGIVAADPTISLVRRAITRAPDLGGEDYDALTPDTFGKAAQAGRFCVHWGAHGMFYGIPQRVLNDVANGKQCLANFSRTALSRAADVFPAVTVLNITAGPATLARRLHARDRETPKEIAKRLAQAAKPLPAGMDVVTVSNDGPLAETVAAAIAALHPVRA